MEGILVLIFAGLCQGSFGLGYKKYKPFSWAAFWGIYSVFCALIPLVWAAIMVPDFTAYYGEAGFSKVAYVAGCGALWGITAVGFSKAVTYIGISLVYGISMGVSAVTGSVIPMIISGTSMRGNSIIFFAAGVIVTLAGIIIITKAGLKKDEEQAGKPDETADIADKEQNKASVTGSMRKGLLLAMFSGFGSGAMNIGFEGLAEFTGNLNYVQASAVQWFPLLFGGALVSVTYCIIELTKNKTWNTYTMKGAPFTICKLFLSCVVWFAALAAYGTSANMLGEMGPVAGWIVFNALALIVSNAWGIKLGEWKGTDKAKKLLLAGNAVLILSWVFIGLSNM